MIIILVILEKHKLIDIDTSLDFQLVKLGAKNAHSKTSFYFKIVNISPEVVFFLKAIQKPTILLYFGIVKFFFNN